MSPRARLHLRNIAFLLLFAVVLEAGAWAGATIGFGHTGYWLMLLPWTVGAVAVYGLSWRGRGERR